MLNRLKVGQKLILGSGMLCILAGLLADCGSVAQAGNALPRLSE